MSIEKKFEEIRKEEKSFRNLSYFSICVGICGLPTAFFGLLADPEQTPYFVVGGMGAFALGIFSGKMSSYYSRYLRSEYSDAFRQRDKNSP
ncbi:MAG: hypothetical protein AABX93_01095 [Nanoarchaeota archaeon]